MPRQTKTEKSATDLIHIFAPCTNFPKDFLGVQALAEALESAARQTGVAPKAIVEACAAGSPWCPTAYELLQVAIKLKGEQRVGFPGCANCSYSGWVMTTKRGYECATPCPDCRKSSAA